MTKRIVEYSRLAHKGIGMRHLLGKTALVTGGTSGIGRAVALELARNAADVWIVRRDRERGEAVVATAAAQGFGQVHFLQADVSKVTHTHP